MSKIRLRPPVITAEVLDGLALLYDRLSAHHANQIIGVRFARYLPWLRRGSPVEAAGPTGPLRFTNEADFLNWLCGRFPRLDRAALGEPARPLPLLAEDLLDDDTPAPPH